MADSEYLQFREPHYQIPGSLASMYEQPSRSEMQRRQQARRALHEALDKQRITKEQLSRRCRRNSPEGTSLAGLGCASTPPTLQDPVVIAGENRSAAGFGSRAEPMANRQLAFQPGSIEHWPVSDVYQSQVEAPRAGRRRHMRAPSPTGGGFYPYFGGNDVQQARQQQKIVNQQREPPMCDINLQEVNLCDTSGPRGTICKVIF